MSIVTKAGDKGETSLIGGIRVKKNDPRIEAYGTVDELNAMIGIALVYAKDPDVRKTLLQVQNHLFTIGAELAALGVKRLAFKVPRITKNHVEFLEKPLFEIEKKLSQQKRFILPNGVESACFLHLARTICRRAERTAMMCERFAPNPEIIKYLNRLSDLLFIFARKENQGKFKEANVKYA